VNATQIRNRVAVILLGFVVTAVTYLLFRRLPEPGLSGTYMTANLVVFALLIGGIVVTRLSSHSYWYEVVTEFFLSFAASSVAVFAYLTTDLFTVGLLVAAVFVGGVVSEGIAGTAGVLRGYQFVGFLLVVTFSFVVLYVAASIVDSGNPTLLPPLVIYTVVFAAVVYGLREEVKSFQSP